MEDDTSRYLRYVPHHLIAGYEAIGWEVADTMEDIHHGRHAVLMRRKKTVPAMLMDTPETD